MKRILLFCLPAFLLLNSCRDARLFDHPEWAKYYEDEGIKNAGIILRNHAHDAVDYYNLSRDTAHVMPASTFKIMLSLVALELGVVQDDKFVIPWNGQASGKPEWDKDLTLREAFAVSSEPYFKEVARKIGAVRLQHYLDTVRYGNQKMGDSVATCWTDNTLQISADEQVGLMKKLYFNQLPFTDRSQRIVRSLMLRGTEGNRKMYYKTGWGTTATTNVLWVVGFAEYEQKIKEQKGSMNKSDERNYVYFFAQNFEVPRNDTSKNWADIRIKILGNLMDDFATKNQSK